MAFRWPLPCVLADADLLACLDVVAVFADADHLLRVAHGSAALSALGESAWVMEFVDLPEQPGCAHTQRLSRWRTASLTFGLT